MSPSRIIGVAFLATGAWRWEVFTGYLIEMEKNNTQLQHTSVGTNAHKHTPCMTPLLHCFHKPIGDWGTEQMLD